MHDIGFVIAGFAVGLIVGLTGVGGGSLMTPILIFFFGVKPYMAVGTDLLFAAFTKAGGTISLMRQRLVPWRVVGQLCAGSLPASFATLYALHELGAASAAVQKLMTTTLGCALLLTAGATLFKAIRMRKPPQRVMDSQGQRVATGGGGAVQVTMNVTTPDVEGFRKSEAQLQKMLARAVGRGRRGL